jgi:hypothetical protein
MEPRPGGDIHYRMTGQRENTRYVKTGKVFRAKER